jgi:hypothetical protein
MLGHDRGDVVTEGTASYRSSMFRTVDPEDVGDPACAEMPDDVIDHPRRRWRTRLSVWSIDRHIPLPCIPISQRIPAIVT